MRKDLVLHRSGRNPLKWGFALEERSFAPALSFDAYAELVSSFVYNGLTYSQPAQPQESIGETFAGFSHGAYKSNAIVFACMAVRQHLFSEARFQFRQLRNGRPGDLFGNADLAPLENPEPGVTTGDMLARMIVHADLGGNWFGTNRYGGVRTLRPDWMSIIIGSPSEGDYAMWDPEAEVAGYVYKPGGAGSGESPILFFPEEIAHFAPIPDPEARFRGMSWLTPVIRDVMSDKAFTDHKLRFTEQGATPNMLVKMPVEDVQKYSHWVEKFREQHEGHSNSFKTLFLGAGMDATPIGTDFRQLDFKNVQAGGETRIAAAAGVPAVVVGLSEGLAGSSLNAGNYSSARRRLADVTIRPLWRNAAGSLSRLVKVPSDAELWYDDRDIPALHEDQKDAAEIIHTKTNAMAMLIMNGYEPASVTDAVSSGDLSRLVHSGLLSVQLQPPGQTAAPPNGQDAPPTNTNGNANGKRDAFAEIEAFLRDQVTDTGR